MKRLFIVLLLLALPVFAQADSVTKTLNFAWDQNQADLPNLAKWTLKMRSTSGGATSQAIDVPYTTGAGPSFTSTQALTVTGAAGAVVRKWFVVTATSKNGQETGPSNEVYFDFQLPFANVTTPINLTVTVTVQ